MDYMLSCFLNELTNKNTNRMSNQDSGCSGGCGALIVVIIVIALIVFFALGFIGNMSQYMRTGNKDTADTAGLFFLLLAGVIGFILYVYKKR